MIKPIIIAVAAATLLVGSVALAGQTQGTGNDNGHGDHGCHIGEQGNGVIINLHCPKHSPSPSPSASASPTPSPSCEPPHPEPDGDTNDVDCTATPSPTPSPSVQPTTSPVPSVSPQLVVLPDTGGTGRTHR